METADDLIQQGQDLETEEQYVAALSTYERALKIDGRRIDAYSGIDRCAERLPDAYFQELLSLQTTKADAALTVRRTLRQEARNHIRDRFQAELKHETDRLKTQPIELTVDEIRLIAGVRMLKSYGNAVAKMEITRGIFESFNVESVKSDFSLRQSRP